MNKIGIIAAYEIRQLLHRRWFTAFLFILPMLFIFLLGSALSFYFNSDLSFKGPILIAAAIEDRGPAGERFHSFLKEEEAGGRIAILPADSQVAMRKLLTEGKADTGIYVPAGFSGTALAGDPVSCDIVLRSISGKSYLGQMILSRFVDALNDALAAAKVSGTDISAALQAIPMNSQDGNIVRRAKLSPTDKQYSALQYYGASMLVMFMLYSGMMAAISLTCAKENHTLSRLYTMPIRPFDVLAGKLGGFFGIALFQAALLIVGTRFLFGLDWGNRSWLLALICVLVITCSMSIALIVGSFARTQKEVHIIMQPLIIVMTFLSGGFSPDVGEFLSFLGQFTVSHWANQGILHIMLDSEWNVIVRQIAFLGLISAVSVLAAVQTFRKVGYH